MNNIGSRQELADYCLRQLGGGVINIEVTPEQLDDAVNDAFDYFQQYHFDGIMQDYISRKITGTVFSVVDGTQFQVGDFVSYGTVTAKIIGINTNLISISKSVGGVFANGNTVTNGTASSVISGLILGDVDSLSIPMPDPVVGIVRVLPLTSILTSSDYMFNVQYQLMMSEIQNISSMGAQYLYGAMTYLGHLDFLLKKEKNFRFNRRMNKMFLDIDWNRDVHIGDFLVTEVYKAIDDAVYSEVLNDIWLKRYTTALIKKTWGSNLKKYQGVQLPGGVTYNGQQIYEEAISEIEKLEQIAVQESAPLMPLIG